MGYWLVGADRVWLLASLHANDTTRDAALPVTVGTLFISNPVCYCCMPESASGGFASAKLGDFYEARRKGQFGVAAKARRANYAI